MTFSEYVAHYGLTRFRRSRAALLVRCLQSLIRNIPEDLKTEELLDVTEWLGELVRQVDSSLIDEWPAPRGRSGKLFARGGRRRDRHRAERRRWRTSACHGERPGVQGDGAQRAFRRVELPPGEISPALRG